MPIRPYLAALSLFLVACGERTPQLHLGRNAGEEYTGPGDVREAAPANTCNLPPLVQVSSVSLFTRTSPRAYGTACYDAARDRIVVYGGLRGSGDYTPDVVAIGLQPASSTVLGWVGSAPEGWTSAGTACDPLGDRVFVVGGWVEGDITDRAMVLRPAGNTAMKAQILPKLPTVLDAPSVGFDSDSGRLVVFGGYNQRASTYPEETLVMYPDDQNPTWKVLSDAGGPPGQEQAAMTFVPGYGVVLLSSSERWTGESLLWALKSGSEVWESIPMSTSWQAGNKPSLFWDHRACSLIAWGGGCTSGAHSIQLLQNPAVVTEIRVPSDVLPRVFMNAALDVDRRRIIVHGGYDCEVDIFLDTVETSMFL